MEEIKMFLANNYLWFLIGAGVFALALGGFIMDLNKKKKLEKEGAENVVPNAEENVNIPETEPTANAFEQDIMLNPMPIENNIPNYSEVPNINNTPVDVPSMPDMINPTPEVLPNENVGYENNPINVPYTPVNETVNPTPVVETVQGDNSSVSNEPEQFM